MSYNVNGNQCGTNKREPDPCKCSCNPQTPYIPIEDPNCKCCETSIRKALQAIQEAVNSTGIH